MSPPTLLLRVTGQHCPTLSQGRWEPLTRRSPNKTHFLSTSWLRHWHLLKIFLTKQCCIVIVICSPFVITSQIYYRRDTASQCVFSILAITIATITTIIFITSSSSSSLPTPSSFWSYFNFVWGRLARSLMEATKVWTIFHSCERQHRFIIIPNICTAWSCQHRIDVKVKFYCVSFHPLGHFKLLKRIFWGLDKQLLWL